MYILTNKNKTVLYIGVTSNLFERVIQHKNKIYSQSFTAKYNCDRLIYFEEYQSMLEAIQRERQLKSGSRRKKLALIEAQNPEWNDLMDDI